MGRAHYDKLKMLTREIKFYLSHGVNLINEMEIYYEPDKISCYFIGG
jgi:hypothetical protein